MAGSEYFFIVFFRCQTKTNNIVTVIKFVIDWNGLLLDGGDSLQCVIFYSKRHNSQHTETKYLITASDRQSNSLSHLFSIVYVLANIILHNSKGNPRMLEWKMSSLIAKVIDWKWLNWIKYTTTFRCDGSSYAMWTLKLHDRESFLLWNTKKKHPTLVLVRLSCFFFFSVQWWMVPLVIISLPFNVARLYLFIYLFSTLFNYS